MIRLAIAFLLLFATVAHAQFAQSLLLSTPAPPIPSAYVQGCGQVSSSGSTTEACTLPSGVGAGHLLIVWSADFSAGAPTGVSGNGNTYTAVDREPTIGVNTYYVASAAAGSTTVTVSWPAADGFAMGVEEYTCPVTSCSLDKHGTVYQSSTSTPTSPSVTTTSAEQLVWAVVVANTGSGALAPAGGATARLSQTAAFAGALCAYSAGICDSFFEDEDITQSVAGTISLAFSYASSATDFSTSIMTFKP